jgi:hypothetical protein
MRVQALRQKREVINSAANQDAWVLHVVDAEGGGSGCRTAAGVGGRCRPSIEENVSENGIDSHDAAFETYVSEQPWEPEVQTIR